MEKNKSYLNLKKFCLMHGADLFGVADIRQIKRDFRLSQKLLAKFNKAICVGVRLSASVLEEIENGPTKLYFHHYRTANAFLDQLALKAANYIQRAGFSALPVPASIILDWENQKAHLSHKKIGFLAGLGWIGRNNLLVNKELGSQFRLATILTDMHVKADRPTEENCASCRLCISVCPAGSIKESPEDFNHLKCFEKLKDFQKQKLVDQYICGICVNICRGPKK